MTGKDTLGPGGAGHFDDERARTYEERIVQIIPGYDVLHDLAHLILGHETAEDAHILVVGAGTGKDIVSLARDCPGRRFTGVDPSPEMLALARSRIEAEGLAGRVTLHQGFVHDLPPDQVFDAATCILVMQFLPDVPGEDGKSFLLRNIARRLKPDAPLILGDGFGDPEDPAFLRFIEVWRKWKLHAGMASADEEKGFEQVLSKIPFVPEGRVHGLLAEAGFGGVQGFYRGLMVGAWIAWKGRS